MAGNGPRIVQVLEFASARAPELQTLHEIAHHPQIYDKTVDAKVNLQWNQRRRRANAFKSHAMPQRLRQKRTTRGKEEEEQLIALSAQGRKSNNVVNVDIAADVTQKAKKPKQRCRKHTRRPHHLLQQHSWETVNSKRNNAERKEAENTGPTAKGEYPSVWLSTHLWHAKRMRMVTRYGMNLAAHRADKSISASLEAVRKKATLHDMSYYGVLELYGLPQLILEALQIVSDPAGSDFHGLRFLSGAEEGQSMLYHENQFPKGAICPVTFMWRPLRMDMDTAKVASNEKTEDAENKFRLHEDWQSTRRQLWLWIHPAVFMEAATAIASACRSVVEKEDEVIQILDRRGHLSRFKLRGKLADQLLSTICNLTRFIDASYDQIDDGDESDHDDRFELSFTTNECKGSNLEHLINSLQDDKSKQRKSAAGVASQISSIHTVIVADPRLAHGISARQLDETEYSLLQEPSKAEISSAKQIKCPLSGVSLCSMGVEAEEPESELILNTLAGILKWTTTPNENRDNNSYPYSSPAAAQHQPSTKDDMDMEAQSDPIPCSFLWSHSRRDLLNKKFRKDHELNDILYQFRVGQERLDHEQVVQTSGMHLMVIKKVEPFPHTSGWDIILLPCFAATLLKSLAFAGALVVGMDEDAALATVLHQPSFPRDFPDTKAGRTYWQEIEDELEAAQLRKPKGKRVEYAKFGVSSPFQPNWKALFSEDYQTDMKVREEDETMNEYDEGTNATSGAAAMCVLRGETYMEPFCFFKPVKVGNDKTDEPAALIPMAIPTLVRVTLTFPWRASPSPSAILLSPSEVDLQHFYDEKDWKGENIEKLYPESVSSERNVVGYVTSAVYDRPKGAFRAMGYCACTKLQQLFFQQMDRQSFQQVLVMMRTPEARMYRPVLVHVAA